MYCSGALTQCVGVVLVQCALSNRLLIPVNYCGVRYCMTQLRPVILASLHKCTTSAKSTVTHIMHNLAQGEFLSLCNMSPIKGGSPGKIIIYFEIQLWKHGWGTLLVTWYPWSMPFQTRKLIRTTSWFPCNIGAFYDQIQICDTFVPLVKPCHLKHYDSDKLSMLPCNCKHQSIN